MVFPGGVSHSTNWSDVPLEGAGGGRWGLIVELFNCLIVPSEEKEFGSRSSTTHQTDKLEAFENLRTS
jgi:hypothetical protein